MEQKEEREEEEEAGHAICSYRSYEKGKLHYEETTQGYNARKEKEEEVVSLAPSFFLSSFCPLPRKSKGRGDSFLLSLSSGRGGYFGLAFFTVEANFAKASRAGEGRRGRKEMQSEGNTGSGGMEGEWRGRGGRKGSGRGHRK